MNLTPAQRKALKALKDANAFNRAAPPVHASTLRALQRRRLVEGGKITKWGQVHV